VRVFFYVQHLLGIGHLKRAATLARALTGAGFDVTLVSGGEPVEGIPVLQLPPASSPDFKQLLDENGKPVDEAWKRRRRAALLDAYARAAPDVVLIELFPFGRRQMRFELLPLLEVAIATPRRPLVVCSVRDLIQSNPAREDETLESFARYFDRLLVHGDPRIATFERSFRHAPRLAGRLYYTGYVVEETEREGDAGTGEVLVSAGGGAVGRRLLETAIEARALTRLRDRTWRILAGMNAKDIDSLKGEGVIVERSRDDFTLRLRNCALSVSQAGYNTVMETLQAGARAVLVPFAAGAESEQTLRARLLAERGLLDVVEENSLSPVTLAAAMDRAASRPRPARGTVDLGGARASAELLRQWLA
jgi:predicted glycosyltransferase